MLLLSSKLFSVPVFSFRTGGPVGTATEPIINPNNLKIEGWHAVDRFSKQKMILPALEVREFVRGGLAVNDHEAMTDPEDMVRLQKILQINFKLHGKKVITEKHQKIGRVTDYSFDPASLYIQKLYVSKRGLKSLTGDDRLIGRGQIVQINDKVIVVRDTDVTANLVEQLPAAAKSRADPVLT